MLKYRNILLRAVLYTLVFSLTAGCAERVIVVTATPVPTETIPTYTPTPTLEHTSTPVNDVTIEPTKEAETTPTQETDTHTPDPWSFRTCGVVTARAGLNIRPYPAVDNEPIGKLPEGTDVIIDLWVSAEQEQWYYIEVPTLANLEGWVSRAWVNTVSCLP